MPDPTPVGKSAADMDPRRAPQAPPAVHPATVPGGVTPIGATAQEQQPHVGTPPRPPKDTVSLGEAETPIPQVVANFAMLARQAIAMGWGSMQVQPRNLAIVCAEFERLHARVRELEEGGAETDGGDAGAGQGENPNPNPNSGLNSNT